MYNARVIWFCSLALALPVIRTTNAGDAPSSTTFTYQGRLEFQGRSYDGAADYRFTLWDAASEGAQIGNADLESDTPVNEGLFTVGLDFGAAAHGPNRFLQIEVRTPAWDGQGDEPPYFVFPQRQALTPAPYALQTRGLFVNDAGDAIGIGTTTPERPLQIASSAGLLIGESGAVGGFTGLSLDLSSANNGFARLQGIRSAGSAWGDLVLNPFGGHVGINTSSASDPLTVNGNLRLLTGNLRFPDGSVQTKAFDADIVVVTIPPGADVTVPPFGRSSREFNVPEARDSDIVLAGDVDRSTDLFIRKATVEEDGVLRIIWQNASAVEANVTGSFRVILFH